MSEHTGIGQLLRGEWAWVIKALLGAARSLRPVPQTATLNLGGKHGRPWRCHFLRDLRLRSWLDQDTAYKHFDRHVVDAFLKIEPEFIRIAREFVDA